MGKRCCGCFGSGSSCCGCCCSKRGATVCFSLVGLALAVAVIVPPVYVYAATEERNFQLLFPALELSKDALEHVRIAIAIQNTYLYRNLHQHVGVQYPCNFNSTIWSISHTD